LILRLYTKTMSLAPVQLTIKPRKGWQPVDMQELWNFRELLGFLAWRDIKVRYKQTALGGLWAVVQPLIAMVIFAGLFSRISSIHSDSPYLLFVYSGLVPWMFFANAITMASNSLVGSEQMIRKIYFPRLFVPLGTIAALGLDVLIGLVFMAVLLAAYRWHITLALLWLPFFVSTALLVSCGLGLILSALNVRYRDVKYIVPFFTQMALFVTPVVYPLSFVTGPYKALLFLNPMSGIVEGFRHALLGSPISPTLVATSTATSVALFFLGLYCFRRMELTFADLI
jgi:lipopolysaccharide transport system permease protein